MTEKLEIGLHWKLHMLELTAASVLLGWALGLVAVYIVITRFLSDEIGCE